MTSCCAKMSKVSSKPLSSTYQCAWGSTGRIDATLSAPYPTMNLRKVHRLIAGGVSVVGAPIEGKPCRGRILDTLLGTPCRRIRTLELIDQPSHGWTKSSWLCFGWLCTGQTWTAIQAACPKTHLPLDISWNPKRPQRWAIQDAAG